MIYIDKYRCIESAKPEDVFALLSDTKGFLTMLPRLNKAELTPNQDGTQRLMLCLSIGGLFGTLCFDGHVDWIEPQEIVFQARSSLKGEIRWSLQPGDAGTHLRVTATLDIAPLLGPLVHFVPQKRVEHTIGNELEKSLRDLSRKFENHSLLPLQPQPALAS